MHDRAASPRRRRLLAALAGALAASAVGAAERTFEIAIENGRVPEGSRTVRVTEGDTVRLSFRVDRPMTLHLHGYDIESRAEPGKVAEMRFVARATGRFPVHAHGAAAGGGEALLLYVEVYPR